jgi:hypothetical protein
MNEHQIKTLMDGIIQLPQTIEVLTKKNATDSEIVAFDKVKRVFISLMELPLHNSEDLEVYEFDSADQNFQLVV